MEIKEQFLTVELNLPNHSNELYKAEEVLEMTKYKFKEIQSTKTINNNNFNEIQDTLLRILHFVGSLSIPAFDTRTTLEEVYFKKYKSSPQLAKQLWLEHFEQINHPYNLLKNRCFKMLEELDEEYILRLKKYPPNWR